MIRYNKIPIHIVTINWYLKRPVICDSVFTVVILFALLFLQHKGIISTFDYEIIKSLNSDLISTSISLAGFILASLTIIVTFKDSVTSRNIDVSDNKKNQNGRDLFFLSKHYYPTVKIFYRASLILLLIFFLLAIIKLINDNLNRELFSIIVVGSLIIIVTTVLRSLYLLLQIIKLQNQEINKTDE